MAENLENLETNDNGEFNNEDARLNVSPGLTLEVREDPQDGHSTQRGLYRRKKSAQT